MHCFMFQLILCRHYTKVHETFSGRKCLYFTQKHFLNICVPSGQVSFFTLVFFTLLHNDPAAHQDHRSLTPYPFSEIQFCSSCVQAFARQQVSKITLMIIWFGIMQLNLIEPSYFDLAQASYHNYIPFVQKIAFLEKFLTTVSFHPVLRGSGYDP